MLAVVAALHDGLTVEPVHGPDGHVVGWQVSLVIPDDLAAGGGAQPLEPVEPG